MASRDGALARAYFDSDGFRDHLAELVAIPSTSQDPGHEADVQRYLADAIQPWLEQMGFAVEIHPNPKTGFGPILEAAASGTHTPIDPRFADREGNEMRQQFEGGCLCGAVRFVATGDPIGVAWCHCQSCRKHSGAPVSVFVAFRRDAFTVTKGEITKFNSSPGRWRGFCPTCGSTLTCEGESSPEMHFHVGAFDEAARLQPTRHIFPEECMPWLHLSEDPEQ